MKKNLLISLWFTLVTTVLFGLIYPLAVTGLSQLLFPGTGNGYDSTSSSGSNLGPTSKALLDRVNGDVQKLRAENPGSLIPVDLVTTSGSGLDPDVSPAAAEFQIYRVARERHVSEAELR